MHKVTMDGSKLFLQGVLILAYWHNGQIIDIELVYDVMTREQVELEYGIAYTKWFGKAAAYILSGMST